MADGFHRVNEDYAAFRESIEKCRTSDKFVRPEWQDAYARGSRVRERYIKEKKQHNLTPYEGEALSKVFDDDVFTKGMMNIRHVGEHVQKRPNQESFEIRTPHNQPIELSAETSAMQMFAGPVVFMTDIHGIEHRIDHLEQLETLDQRIGRAIGRAKP